MTNENIISDKSKKASRRRYLFIAGLFVLLILAGLTFSFFRWEPKPDPDSEMKIRKEVSRIIFNTTNITKEPNNLTNEDFETINRLTLGYPDALIAHTTSSDELCDIVFLEEFTNLQYLCLGKIKYPSNKIPKWMSLLEKTGILKLKDRYSLDLTPLKKLNNLDILIIHDTSVSNFKIIKKIFPTSENLL